VPPCGGDPKHIHASTFLHCVVPPESGNKTYSGIVSCLATKNFMGLFGRGIVPILIRKLPAMKHVYPIRTPVMHIGRGEVLIHSFFFTLALDGRE